ncbi:MAG TPA: TrkA family potassium uptake protein [Gemmatimonadota bacterium]|nr:TrkA family potassium uptake protein [Gemmatimonadota bacterium]
MASVKRFLVIGLGHFGSWVARALHAQGHEVISIEERGELVDRYAPMMTRGVVGDATNRDLLREIGAATVDAAVISTGEDLATSILATLALREMGVEEIYVKVTSPEAARALDAFQVRETIFPEREVAFRLAHRIASKTVLDYLPLSEGYSIQEIAIPDEWLGKSLRELSLPQRFGIQVVAIYDVLNDSMQVVPDPEKPLKESDVAIVAGQDERVARVLGEDEG